MSDPFDRPVVSPIMVGREAHLAALERCVDATLSGVGQTVLVAGEAGIGKSRLVKAAAAYAQAQGMCVLVGQCFAPDRTIAYGPWRDLICTQLLHQTWAEELVAEVAPDLRELMPELSRVIPASTLASRTGAEDDRRLISAALTRLVVRLAGQSPLLLIVEDVHWSDDASLELLVTLARVIRGGPSHPVTLIISFRSDDVTAPLAALLASLARERLAAEARLGPLPRAEVMAMLRAMSDHHGLVNPELAEAIFRLSEGNPFFVEELFRSILTMDPRTSGQVTTSGIPLPQTITEAIWQRARDLSEGAREALTIAAVSGRRFDFDVLQALSGCDEAELLARIKELIEAKLVVEESVDRFAFRHALMRQAIDDRLLARERRALHQRILSALLTTDDDARDRQAADLARHAAAAGAWAEAFAFGQRAGEQALALFAPGVAVEMLSLAIDAATHLNQTAPASLIRARGQAHDALGSFEAARADYERAVSLARESGSGREEGEALLALGSLWAGRNYEQVGVHVQQALALARAQDDQALAARALNRLANWHANREDPAVAFRLHEEALALLEALDDRRGIAETLDLTGMARYLAGDFAGSAAAYRRVIPLLREIGDRRTLVNALTGLAFATSPLDVNICQRAPGSDEERLALVEEAILVAREIDGRAEEALAHGCAALIAGERRLDEALAHGQRGLLIAEEIGHRQWAILSSFLLGYLNRLLLDGSAAGQHLEAALALARTSGSPFWIREVIAELVVVRLLDGDLDAAETLIAPAVRDDTPMRTLDQREAWFSLAQVALARGQPDRALQIVDRLLLVATADPVRDLAHLPSLALVKGEALLAIGSADHAAIALTAAHDGALAHGNRSLLWRVHLARAAHLRGLGQRADAAKAIAAAHATVQEIATDIADPLLRDAFHRRARAILPALRRLSPPQAAKASYAGLTAREREVAALIAAGHSNREIGDALFMTERTAATHVGNILGKLGVKTRAQIAAWAQERDLASSRGE